MYVNSFSLVTVVGERGDMSTFWGLFSCCLCFIKLKNLPEKYLKDNPLMSVYFTALAGFLHDCVVYVYI